VAEEGKEGETTKWEKGGREEVLSKIAYSGRNQSDRRGEREREGGQMRPHCPNSYSLTQFSCMRGRKEHKRRRGEGEKGGR